MRLIMIGRAVEPPPAMAPSTHLLPVASKALASSATAAASPPEVHQWVTSRSVACAAESGSDGRRRERGGQRASISLRTSQFYIVAVKGYGSGVA